MNKRYIQPRIEVVTIDIEPIMTSTMVRGDDYTSGTVTGDAAQLRRGDWSDYEGQ